MTQPRLLGGRYELDGVVGRGGMAEVYRARDIRLDRIVAVKTLREDLARDQTFQARFRREAQSAASLNHPSIVAVYDTGEDMTGPAHVPYIVMEYVDGRTLRELLRDDRRLLPERALEITDGVLRALDYSHRNGIIHRDIKPGNVMLTRSAEVKVMDFGIARAMSDTQATMTQTAQVIGTAQYLSPEQARGERVDARSDLYSTGCLLYELLTGRPPFTGDSPVAIAYQHVRENPIPPSRIDPEIPPWADAIVLKAMAKDPADRYQSAAEMRTDIQRALSGVPVAAPSQTEMYAPGTQRMGAQTMMAGAGAPTGTMSHYGGPEDGYDDGSGGGRRRALWWILGAVGVIIVAVLAYLLLNGGNGNTASVPSVVGQTQAQAVSSVKKAGLNPVVVKVPSSDKVGIVVSSNPQFGTKVAPHSNVTLRVSAGPKKVTIPNVVGQSQGSAQSTLQGLGLDRDDQDGSDVHPGPGQGGQDESALGHPGEAGQHGDAVRLRRRHPGAVGHRRPEVHGRVDPQQRGIPGQGRDGGRSRGLDPGYRVQPAADQRHHRGERLHGDHLRGRGCPADFDADQRLAHPDGTRHAHPDRDRDADPVTRGRR